MTNTPEHLTREHISTLSQQKFMTEELDYSILERHKVMLSRLAEVGNSGVTVFDLSKGEHVFSSYNMQELFGFDVSSIKKIGNDYINSKTHPDDYLALMRNGITLMRFFYSIPIEDRPNYKLINEYRILNSRGQYIRVIEQHQILEMDPRGNVWLALAVMDVSPHQEEYQGVKSQLFNYKTGKLVPVISLNGNTAETPELTQRERQVLGLIRDGYLSKEISEKLFISIHTVNTHRQRILEKLGVDNSMEAVRYASQLGLLQ
ncbi:MAG: LuxR C-terminal-related transcriptional regulator [Bacteroidota bacterium]|nr:LuxR C-terminal-related transcriptional regulator [Bacteroidota bacterium]